MMTIDEVRAELAHLREVPARLRLERLMRESGGLVDMLEVCLRNACSIQEASPAVEPQSVVYHANTDPIVETIVVAHDGPVELSSTGTWKSSEPEPIKRKRGRPARRVADAENGGEA